MNNIFLGFDVFNDLEIEFARLISELTGFLEINP